MEKYSLDNSTSAYNMGLSTTLSPLLTPTAPPPKKKHFKLALLPANASTWSPKNSGGDGQ